MKVSDLVKGMTFSHRPQDGISVGFATIAGVAYMSVSFVRDGDYFNRKLARNILAQRIFSTVFDGNENVKYVEVVEHLTDVVDARAIVREFRKTFKPDPNCNDATFSDITAFSPSTNPSSPTQVQVRTIHSREYSYAQIAEMFRAAVTAASNAPAKVSQ